MICSGSIEAPRTSARYFSAILRGTTELCKNLRIQKLYGALQEPKSPSSLVSSIHSYLFLWIWSVVTHVFPVVPICEEDSARTSCCGCHVSTALGPFGAGTAVLCSNAKTALLGCDLHQRTDSKLQGGRAGDGWGLPVTPRSIWRFPKLWRYPGIPKSSWSWPVMVGSAMT